MELKRLYKKDALGGVVYEIDKHSDGYFPVVIGVEIKRLPVNGKQKLSPKLIKQGKEQGWLTISDDLIQINDTKFKIVGVPSHECLHCGHVDLSQDMTGQTCRNHIAAKHKGKKSPDPDNNPSGYVRHNYYMTEVEV